MTPEQRRAALLRALHGILTMADVYTLFGKSDDTIRRWVNEGTFPPPGHLSRVSIWTTSQIERYLDQLVEQARLEAERTRTSTDNKTKALFRGEPHGPRL